MLKQTTEWAEQLTPLGILCLKLALWLVSIASFVWASLHAVDGDWRKTLSALSVAATAGLLAQLDRIVRFSLTLKGVEAELRKTVERAEVTLAQVQSLADAVVRTSLGGLVKAGWLQPWSDEHVEAERARLCGALKTIGRDDSRIDRMLEECWHPFVRSEYVWFVTSSSRLPNGCANPETVADLHGITRRPHDCPATASEVESVLRKWGFLTPLRAELLEDLRYYEQHKRHRRPKVFALRDKAHVPLDSNDSELADFLNRHLGDSAEAAG
jgi:hypothetical protein